MMRSGEIVICEQEAETVRIIFRLAAEGKTAGDIAEHLHGDEYFEDCSDKGISKIHGILRKEYYCSSDTYPAIVDSELFHKARLCIRERDHYHNAGKTKIPFKLTCCGSCGRQLIRGRNVERRYWKCGNTSCLVFTEKMYEDELYLQIAEILRTVQSDTALLDTDTKLTEYVPSKIILRRESEVLARCYIKPLDYDRVRAEIAALAALKYDCCTYSRAPAQTREIKAFLAESEPIEHIEPEILRAVIKKVILNNSHNISVEFINGKTIKYGGNEDV